MTDQAIGSARAIAMRLQGRVDLLALYARLTDQGRRNDTMMFETIAGKSVIVDQAALRIECRGGDVVIDALSNGGQTLLRVLKRNFAEQVRAGTPHQLTLHYQRSNEVDTERRLNAPSPFDVLRIVSTTVQNETPEEPMAVCLIGILAFDHVELFEDLPPNLEDHHGFPDFVFWLAESAVIAEPNLAPRLLCTSFSTGDELDRKRSHNSAIERLRDLAFRSSDIHPLHPDPGSAGEVSADLDDQAFATAVTQLKEHILAGDVYQIVLSRTFSAACPDPLSAFARVRSIDRSPYMFFVSMKDFTLFGASPETAVRISRDRRGATVEVKPIAGTRPRGADGDEDDRLEADLRLDGKEAAEHMMLVDLARNDVARVSEPGTRHVAQLMALEKYARVMHLASSVKGCLRTGYDALHVLKACLNPGTLTGAPKLKATQLLRQYERTRRGPYGGSIGWLNGEGALDTAIIIRSALVRDGTAYVRAGAGIVHESDPMAETDETRRKASAVLSAIAGEQPR